MFEVRDLSVAYGDLRVLWGVSFSGRPGELVAIIGPNGAGKTTTFKAIAGLVDVQKGTVTLDGTPTRGSATA